MLTYQLPSLLKRYTKKIGRFNNYVGTSKNVQYVYLIQAVLQALLTVIFFLLNVLVKDDIKGTAKCSVDEYFPVIYDYFTCSHNLDESTTTQLNVLWLKGCGPLYSQDFYKLKNFSNLLTLGLVNCGLTKISKVLFQLDCLETLSLKNNSIKQIPSEISSLQKLSNFDISDNDVKTIGSSIQTLPLEIIDISNNPDMEVSAVINVLKCKRLQQLAVSDSSSILESLREEDEQLKEKFQRVARQVEH